MQRMTARLAATAVAGIIAVGAGASTAAAAQQPTPNGLCGARNMVNENAREQMLTAMMQHTDEHGDAGMAGAVAVSGC